MIDAGVKKITSQNGAKRVYRAYTSDLFIPGELYKIGDYISSSIVNRQRSFIVAMQGHEVANTFNVTVLSDIEAYLSNQKISAYNMKLNDYSVYVEAFTWANFSPVANTYISYVFNQNKHLYLIGRESLKEWCWKYDTERPILQ